MINTYIKHLRTRIRCRVKNVHKPHSGSQWSGVRYIGICRDCSLPIERSLNQKWRLFDPATVRTIADRQDQIANIIMADRATLASINKATVAETTNIVDKPKSDVALRTAIISDLRKTG